MSEITSPILLDSTGQGIRDAILGVKAAIENTDSAALTVATEDETVYVGANGEVTAPLMLDSTGREIEDAILQVQEAIKNQASGGGGGAVIQAATIGYVTLLAANWTGSGSLYSQVVTIDGLPEGSQVIIENCQVDLTPSVEQLVSFYEKDLTLVTENDEGVVTVYAIGQQPVNDYTIQVTITEVIA